MPEWVTTAYEDYTRRMRKDMRVDLEEIPVGRARADEEKRLLRTHRRRLPGRARRARQIPNHPAACQVAGGAPAGWPQSHLRHRRAGRPGSQHPAEGRAALVTVGPDLPARHGARDPRRTAVSRALGVAESPLPSRMNRGGGSMAEKQEQEPVLRLASASPRRRELLELIGVPHVVTPADIDETARAAMRRRQLCLPARQGQGAWRCARCTRICRCWPPTPPCMSTAASWKSRADETDCIRMLSLLSGRRHDVFTGLCVVSERIPSLGFVHTTVEFREISPARNTRLLGERRAAGQGGRLRHPGARRGVRRENHRQLHQRHGPAAVRNGQDAAQPRHCGLEWDIGGGTE